MIAHPTRAMFRVAAPIDTDLHAFRYRDLLEMERLGNLVQRRIEVHTDPAGSDYRYRAFHELTAVLAPQAYADTARQWLPDSLYALLDRHHPSTPDPSAATE